MPVKLLRIAVFCLLFGQAWMHWVWSPPYNAIFYDAFVISALGEGYAASETIRMIFRFLVVILGTLYFAAAILALIAKAEHGKMLRFLPACSIALLVLAFCDFKERFFQMPQFFEHAARVAAPFLLYRVLQNRSYEAFLRHAIAVTFAAHGVYALGLYQTPGPFIDMTIHLLRLDEAGARVFLAVVGALDLVVAVGVYSKWSRKVAMYACVWGGLTALARVVSGLQFTDVLGTLNVALPQFLVRVPHAVLPAMLMILLSRPLAKVIPLSAHRKRKAA